MTVIVSANVERRAVPIEVRFTPGPAGNRVEGYAALFNVEANIGGAFREVIRPGAFRRSLAAGADVVCLYNHDPSAVLGRVSAGTLLLSEDAKGLRFSCTLPDTTIGRDVRELVRRGDLAGCSFGFRPAGAGSQWHQTGGVPLHEVVDCTLVEVTLTAFPAYDATTVALRATIPHVPHPRSLRAPLARRYLDTLGG